MLLPTDFRPTVITEIFKTKSCKFGWRNFPFWVSYRVIEEVVVELDQIALIRACFQPIWATRPIYGPDLTSTSQLSDSKIGLIKVLRSRSFGIEINADG